MQKKQKRLKRIAGLASVNKLRNDNVFVDFQ
jgi:hypothetical protein